MLDFLHMEGKLYWTRLFSRPINRLYRFDPQGEHNIAMNQTYNLRKDRSLEVQHLDLKLSSPIYVTIWLPLCLRYANTSVKVNEWFVWKIRDIIFSVI